VSGGARKRPAPIEEFIAEARDSFVGAEHVYTHGSCYYFARMLRAVYGGEIVETPSHAMLRLGGEYYDIRGRVRPDGEPEPAAEPTRCGKFDMIDFASGAGAWRP
jgi:hypothetical protein